MKGEKRDGIGDTGGEGIKGNMNGRIFKMVLESKC